MNLVLSQIWQFIKNLLSLAWAHKQVALYVILAIIIAGLSCKINRDKLKISELSTEKGVLEERLKNQTIITKNQVVYRDRDKVIIKYVPAEGKVTVSETKDGKTELKIKNYGLTLRPGVGAYYSGGMVGLLDVKFAFWDRYSLGLGSSLDSAVIWSSRHIDDMTFGIAQNAELAIGYGRDYQDFSKSRFLFGLRTNF